MDTQTYKVYRIHPGIGIARLGNSTADDWFVGPEVPDFRFAPAPDGNYRNQQRQVRRQGARFRIYEYTYSRPGDTEPLSVREITQREAEIEWYAQLGNQKSFWGSDKHPNVPLGQRLAGPNQRREVDGTVAGVAVRLGTLITDGEGRLVVLGGFGRSDKFRRDAGEPNGIHNAGWYDDSSDGPVAARLKLRGSSTTVEAEPARVIVGVPRYGSPVDCVITLYDIAYDRAVARGLLRPPAEVSFLRDIYPVLFRTVMAQWVSSAARAGHGRGERGDLLARSLFDRLRSNSSEPETVRLRRGLFGKLRRPDGSGGNMPLLAANPSLTPYQYERFRQWSEGRFAADWPEGVSPYEPPRHRPFDQLTPPEQTAALDRAGLETTIGGAFGPGIEGGKILSEPDGQLVYEAPLRIHRRLPAGTLTASLSVPWQSDFNLCVQSWWPSARLGSVTQDGVSFYRWVPWENSNRQMVERWSELGFLKSKPDGSGPPIYVETERLAEIPTGIELGEPPVPEEKPANQDAEAFAARLAAEALLTLVGEQA